jgi:hypothetical protein
MTVFMGDSSWGGWQGKSQTLLAPSTGLATRPSVAPPEVSDGAAMVSDACRRDPHRHDRPPRAHNDRDQRPRARNSRDRRTRAHNSRPVPLGNQIRT